MIGMVTTTLVGLAGIAESALTAFRVVADPVARTWDAVRPAVSAVTATTRETS